jgi:hypothetical protein
MKSLCCVGNKELGIGEERGPRECGYHANASVELFSGPHLLVVGTWKKGEGQRILNFMLSNFCIVIYSG